jgi:protein subunit release factor A
MIEIKPEDIVVDFYYTKDQKCQLFQTPKGCRITHKPSSVVVISEKGMSQYKNRATAFTLLELTIEECY